jgi:hypothetical protein
LPRSWISAAIPAAAALLLAGCANTHTPNTVDPDAVGSQAAAGAAERPERPRSQVDGRSPLPTPAVLRPSQPLQCVPYARAASGIQIRGDAHTWWRQARGNYTRGKHPELGAVMALTTGPNRGHVAVVKRIVNDRKVIVDHANWLNRGQIHANTPVVDVSEAGDWSRVKVWYTPGRQLGSSPYNVVGFIYPERLTAAK